MHKLPTPENEQERLRTLRELDILDTPPEKLFDDISKLANNICGTPVALISLVDQDRQWFKSKIGLEDIAETPRDIAFCAHTILGSSILEIPDATKDARFSDNPYVIGHPYIRFYAGTPIVLSENLIIGSLSVFDQTPKLLREDQKNSLQRLAKLISSVLVDRQATIENIKQQTNKLSAIVEFSEDAIIGKNLNSVITSWNKGAEKLFGYSAKEIIGKPITVIFPEGKLQEEKLFVTSVKSGQPVYHYETQRVKKNGELIDVSVTLSPIKDTKGHVIGISKIARDITSRKKYENRIQRLTKLYKALSEINQAIVRMSDHEALFPLVCRCAVEFGGMDMAFIVKTNPQGDAFLQAACYGSNLSYLDGFSVSPSSDVPEGRGPIGVAFRENRPVIVQDYDSAAITYPWRDRIIKNNWRAGSAFPIQLNNKPFAVLSVYSTQNNIFDEETIALFEEMAKDISFALDNFNRETQRVAAEESLQLAASVFENSSEGIIIIDANDLIIAVNPAFTAITGYSQEEVVGKLPSIFRSQQHDKAFYKELWSTVHKTGLWQGEIWDKRKNGESYPNWLTINTVYHANGSVLRRIAMFLDFSQKKNDEYIIWHQANYDYLTDLPNRQMFYDRLDQEIKKAQRKSRSITLMFIDIDRFKEINDTLGHDVGDLMLKETAQRLKKCVRDSDIVARLGGDEFTIVLSDLDDTNVTSNIAQNIVSELTAPYQLGAQLVHSTVSVGVTFYPQDANTIEVLLKNADQAMYAAKSNGRNCFSYFSPAMQQASRNKMLIANDLRKALSEHQFWIAYQPIVDLHTGEVYKAEALIRWNHPVNGLINPADFIPIAEDTGLIVGIGEWVFQQAALQVKVWRETLHPEFQISVNKSPVQFRKNADLHRSWSAHLQSLGLSGSSVCVEITEGLLLDADARVAETLLDFRNGGIQVSIDDFGTGYSALSYLKKLDIDFLKIDKSFVSNITTDDNDLAVCEAIIEMAHKLNIKLIAEGVETQAQFDVLHKIGCDYGQGYLWSKPLPVLAFEERYQKK